VETVRRELATKPTARKPPGKKAKLSLREGEFIGKLSRKEIYHDVW